MTDDRCPESNTYTHWTGRQSIVPWKHLRNIPRVPYASRARAHHVRATTALLHASNSTPQRPRIHREMSRTYLPTTQLAPFIAADILTPNPARAYAPAARALRMLAFFMKRGQRHDHWLIADHGSRSVEWRSGLFMVLDGILEDLMRSGAAWI